MTCISLKMVEVLKNAIYSKEKSSVLCRKRFCYLGQTEELKFGQTVLPNGTFGRSLLTQKKTYVTLLIQVSFASFGMAKFMQKLCLSCLFCDIYYPTVVLFSGDKKVFESWTSFQFAYDQKHALTNCMELATLKKILE